MIDWFLSVLVGAVTGVLSGFGVGGGTLLLIYLTSIAGIAQSTAQGINLLYFLPAAAMALPSHIHNGYVTKQAALPAIGAGLLSAAAAAWIATSIDVELLRKPFGVYLLFSGISLILPKKAEKK